MSVVANTSETYAQQQGKPAFDWNAFLLAPQHDAMEWEYAEELAGDWVTCACGNQCALLPRDHDNAPIDEELAELGIIFMTRIYHRNQVGARQTLAEIEARTAYLLTLPNYREE